MAIALVVSASKAAVSGNGVTTDAVNTSGASLLVVVLSLFTDIDGTYAVNDSYSNTWSPLTPYGGSNAGDYDVKIFYVENPTVGSGHTFSTATASGLQYPVLCAAAFSGTVTSGVFDKENGHGNSSSTTSEANSSLTPTNANSLVVTGVVLRGFSDSQTFSLNGGFTKQESQSASAGNSVSGALGYLVQSSAAASAPTWSWTNSDASAVTQAVFISAGGGGGSDQPMMRRWGGRSGPVPGIGQSSGGGKAWG